MGNKDWDDFLRELLGDYTSEGEMPHWEEFAQKFNTHPDMPADLEDDTLRDVLNAYAPTGKIEGWEKLEESLDAADRAFDTEVRHRIRQYTPANNPDSWHHFWQQFSAQKIQRTKIIALKISEVAVMALLLMTLIQMDHRGQLQFNSPAVKQIQPLPTMTQVASDANPQEAIMASNSANVSDAAVKNNASPDVRHHPSKNDLSGIIAEQSIATSIVSENQNIHDANSPPTELVPGTFVETNSSISSNDLNALESTTASEPAQKNITEEHSATLAANDSKPFITLAEIGSTTLNPVDYVTTNTVPDPVWVKTSNKSFIQFGMMAQLDYNQLKMPGDHINAAGNQVTYPLQGLTSAGYGGGFNLAIGNNILFLETGMIYSSKSFNPGRSFTLGESVDQSNVEFEAMRMQIISVPLQLRYHFERQGRLKAYAIAGFGLHFIAQSDIDLDVDYNFGSLADGEDPSEVPELARTIRQTQIVSDGFKKKGSFSSHSLISANLGAGLEYAMPDQKMIFLQTAYQYQIPNLRFSNHNSKHLLTVSFQAGVRTPLGA